MVLKTGKHGRALPPWLLGLIIAIVVFVAVVLILAALGYGDDPVVEGLSSLGG